MTTPDANVEQLRELLLKRSEAGFRKYGTTTERTDLSEADWLQHLLEELLDAAVYVAAARAHASRTKHCIVLTEAEVQSGLDRVRWADLLIRQLPLDHEGRNSWLLNYGRQE